MKKFNEFVNEKQTDMFNLDESNLTPKQSKKLEQIIKMVSGKVINIKEYSGYYDITLTNNVGGFGFTSSELAKLSKLVEEVEFYSEEDYPGEYEEKIVVRIK